MIRRIAATAIVLQFASAQAATALAQTPRRNNSSARADTVIAKFPATIPSRGRLPLQLQIMLDRANFSPGIIDGAWGMNAAQALAFFAAGRDTRNTPAARSTATIERATYERLKREAGNAALLVRYTLTSEDVRGPFVDIPSKVYQQAKLKCLCYSSAAEAMSEKFHVSRKLLAELNPQVNLDKLRAGTTLVVPNVADKNVASAADTAIIARLVVSKSGFWTHAEDASGRILFHFPSTLGAGYDPSPTGDFRIISVSHDPAFHYQPKLFSEVPDDLPDARLPRGPNSPVGLVWIGLSKPHYGIHGTSSPETIGYANSHGCVRLTNWDAVQLSDLVQEGTPVVFR
jgi:lipoprotein-anchoring transpeptidase ErfK/SrfK